MLIRDLKDCRKIIAADNTSLRELIHPAKQDIDLRYSLAHAIVKPGAISFLHRLKTSEVYYILEGRGVMYINDESGEVHSGQAIYIPPNAKQCVKNTGESDLKFLCVVYPAWKSEDEEVL